MVNERDPTSLRRRQALLNIYHHTLQMHPPGFEVPEEQQPLPLDDAIRLLHENSDAGDPEQYRAMGSVLARIVGAGLHHKVEPAVRLIMSDLSLPPEVFDEFTSIGPPGDDPESRRNAEQQVFRILEQHSMKGGSPGACTAAYPEVTTIYNPETLVTSVTVEIKVNEDPYSPQRVACLLNPVRWDNTYPGYFTQAYLTGGEVHPDGMAMRTRGPEPRDEESWGAGTTPGQYFYEEVVYPISLQAPEDICVFRNVLNVAWPGLRSGALPINMRYWLRQSTHTEIPGVVSRGAGLTVDRGFSRAEHRDGAWVWTGRKIVRFVDTSPGSPVIPGIEDFGLWLNHLAPASVTLFLESGMAMSACSGCEEGH